MGKKVFLETIGTIRKSHADQNETVCGCKEVEEAAQNGSEARHGG